MNDGLSSTAELKAGAAGRSWAGDVPADPTWRWPARRPWGMVTLFVLAVAAYSSGSQLALWLIERSGLASVFFIPAGVTVALLLRIPRGSWWVVILAAGLAETAMDLLDGYTPGAALGFAIANMLEPVVGALIVTRQCGAVDLARVRHLWWFFVGAVVTAPAVGAAVGSASADLLGDADFLTGFGQWWLGDALGVLLVGGGILVWQSGRDRRSLASVWGAGLILGTALLTIVVVSLSDDTPLMFLVLIGVVVAGALFGSRAVAVTGLLVASIVAMEVAFGPGALIVGLSEADSLIVLKLQLGVFTLAGLVVAAEAREGELASVRATEARALVVLTEREREFQHDVAVRLQEALLPEVPPLHPGVEVAARYEAGGTTLLVGGDWYDVFTLPDDRIGLTVGDVVGRGLEASTAMGRLRTAVAVLAMLTDGPGELLSRLDTYTGEASVTTFATAAYAILDLGTGLLRYASAGHPPMLVVSSTGATRWLDDGASPPLYGAGIDERAEATVRLDPGCLLVAYSDGLVERRDEGLDTGLRRLEEKARELSGYPVGELCDRLMDEMGVATTRDDDVVIVALRYQPPAAHSDR